MSDSTTQNHWELPELTNINRLPMTSCLVPFASPEQARHYRREASSWVVDLNGTWQFQLYDRPEAVPPEVLGGATDAASAFRTIPVLSNLTLEDTGDHPIYTNVKMPFPNTPPTVPAENPTGVYRRTFEVPESWDGRRVVIHFGGVESYYELYVNGSFAGMAKDTRLPSEFDITGLVHSGANQLAVKVIRWSDSSYIEDQDQWWMAGIYRDVYLYSTASAFLEDVFAKADYDYEQRVGRLETSVKFAYVPVSEDDPWRESGPQEDYAVRAELVAASGETVWQGTARIDPSFRVSEYEVTLSAKLPGAGPWSSEEPTLYSLVLTLVTSAGEHVESRCVRLGFRRVELRDRELLINGKPVLIRGVNRHEHDDTRGKVMSQELMLGDITTLKRFNFNAVRTSHYPDTMEWYDLCDEYGIYLVDEANIEAHANYQTICRDPRWALAFEERMMRMVVRDKNHPSVIAWSAGNESGHGENHVRAIDRVRSYDPSRVIHHEGEVKRQWAQQPRNSYEGGSNRYNDLINPMYPTIDSIIEHAVRSRDPRPVILCEYSHAMGNSNGSLAEYWDAFERYHGLQGGFIWEWLDHGIRRTTADGREYWAYGGDFGEEIHDSNFVADGLVWPDRTPHPAMYEFRKLAQPVAVEARSVREGRFVVRSRQDFTALDWLEGRWRLEVEGILVDEGELPRLDVPPGGELAVRLDYRYPDALEMPEAWISFSFVSRTSTPWCEPGWEVAWEQFPANDLQLPSASERGSVVGSRAVTAGATASLADLTREVRDPRLPIQVSDPERLALSAEDAPLLARGPSLSLFRATTDNDGIRGWAGQEAKPMGQWLTAGLNKLTCTAREVGEEEAGGERILVERATYQGSNPEHRVEFEQRIRGAGSDLLRFDFTIAAARELPTLPRVGVILETVPGFEELTWFGRGPQENHIDRKEGYPVGRYASTVAEQYVPYIMPQENGNKCEVRWFELSNGSRRIRFTADPLFEFSAHHFTPADLFACRHTYEVEDRLRKETVVSIDLVQRGVGTGSCGPQTRDPFCVPPGRYTFGFFLEVRPE